MVPNFLLMVLIGVSIAHYLSVRKRLIMIADMITNNYLNGKK